MALTLFHKVATKVPAYKDFLHKNKINPVKVKRWSDFLQVPTVNKKNYLLEYPLEKRCWGGNIEKPLVFTSTSGSTGSPTFFPRGRGLDQQYSYVIERFIKNSSFGYQKPTLVLICFGMGVWIGGLITYQAFEIAANRAALPISILTPGINKKEIINALKLLAPGYHQIVMVGYAPFIRDVIEEAGMDGIDFKSLRVRFLFAAEAISERYRDYLKTVSPKINIYRDTLNIYGSADIGAMAYENGVGIILKRIISNKSTIKEALIGQVSKTPTVAQFDPDDIYFESIDGEILLTGNNEVPLVRYSIGDRGGVLSFDEVDVKLRTKKILISKEVQRNNLTSVTEKKPFVYVYERSDFSTTLYGVNIYPEYIREALLDKSTQKVTTGKFVLETKLDKKQNQYVQIHVELLKGQKSGRNLESRILKTIKSHLLNRSSEFKELLSSVQNKRLIKVSLWQSAHPLFFKPGVKQRWVIPS